jgi:hypothetical protein
MVEPDPLQKVWTRWWKSGCWSVWEDVLTYWCMYVWDAICSVIWFLKCIKSWRQVLPSTATVYRITVRAVYGRYPRCGFQCRLLERRPKHIILILSYTCSSYFACICRTSVIKSTHIASPLLALVVTVLCCWLALIDTPSHLSTVKVVYTVAAGGTLLLNLFVHIDLLNKVAG